MKNIVLYLSLILEWCHRVIHIPNHSWSDDKLISIFALITFVILTQGEQDSFRTAVSIIDFLKEQRLRTLFQLGSDTIWAVKRISISEKEWLEQRDPESTASQAAFHSAESAVGTHFYEVVQQWSTKTQERVLNFL